MRSDAASDQERLVGSATAGKQRACPRTAVHVGRHTDVRHGAAGWRRRASPSDAPGGRLNEMVVAANGALVIDDSGVGARPKRAKADSGTMVSTPGGQRRAGGGAAAPAVGQGIELLVAHRVLGKLLGRAGGGRRCHARHGAWP